MLDLASHLSGDINHCPFHHQTLFHQHTVICSPADQYTDPLTHAARCTDHPLLSVSRGTTVTVPSRASAELQGHLDARAKRLLDPTSCAESPPFQESTAVSSPDSKSQPIRIPNKQTSLQDPNRVPTPLSGRGDRKGAFFPFAGTPSPVEHTISFTPPVTTPIRPFSRTSLHRRRRSSSSFSARSLFEFNMYSEQVPGRYVPTSPLSPRLSSQQRPLSPQPGRSRIGHFRQSSRPMQNNLPRYHPASFLNNDDGMETPRSPSPNHAHGARHRSQQTLEMMRERQRELIDRARMSSKIAASPMGVKPNSPRLDPLGSPKGPVTPLALEEAQDYFSTAVPDNTSPSRSPGPKPEAANDEVPSDPKRQPNPELAR